MSKPNRKVVRLQQMRAQQKQAAGLKYVDVIFEVPGADADSEPEERTCTFLTQDHWPVEVVKRARDAEGSTDLNVISEIASPPEAFAELVSVAKLTVGELRQIIEEMDEENGTTAGEERSSSTS